MLIVDQHEINDPTIGNAIEKIAPGTPQNQRERPTVQLLLSAGRRRISYYEIDRKPNGDRHEQPALPAARAAQEAERGPFVLQVNPAEERPHRDAFANLEHLDNDSISRPDRAIHDQHRKAEPSEQVSSSSWGSRWSNHERAVAMSLWICVFSVLQRIELMLVAKLVLEQHADQLPVNVTIEVKNVHLQQRFIAAVDGGAHTDVGNRLG